MVLIAMGQDAVEVLAHQRGQVKQIDQAVFVEVAVGKRTGAAVILSDGHVYIAGSWQLIALIDAVGGMNNPSLVRSCLSKVIIYGTDRDGLAGVPIARAKREDRRGKRGLVGTGRVTQGDGNLGIGWVKQDDAVGIGSAALNDGGRAPGLSKEHTRGVIIVHSYLQRPDETFVEGGIAAGGCKEERNDVLSLGLLILFGGDGEGLRDVPVLGGKTSVTAVLGKALFSCRSSPPVGRSTVMTTGSCGGRFSCTVMMSDVWPSSKTKVEPALGVTVATDSMICMPASTELPIDLATCRIRISPFFARRCLWRV